MSAGLKNLTREEKVERSGEKKKNERDFGNVL